MKIFKKNSKGFTLIELLVVIAIIGILSSVVLASLNSARKKSRDAHRVADIKQIQLALELEFDKAQAYPSALATLKTDGFIPQVPLDPLNTGSYVYTYCPISATDYHLTAILEDTNNALSSDSDAVAATCTTGTDVDGTAANAYDVKP